MDTVWKLRPNVKWHDGKPFTSADMILTFSTLKDPELPSLPTSGGRPDLMASASAPDPLTFVVHWTGTYVRANEASNLDPLADHIVGDLYRTDKTAFLNHPWFTSEFVGLGAYRLIRWERGSHVEFARFDGYYRGRPALDRVIVRFMGDSNAMIAAILSEAVDVVLPSGETGDIDAALEVKRRWEGTGHQVVIAVKGEVENFEIQHQPAIAKPRNGLTQRPVRQALYHALDRDMLSQATTQGLSPAADSVFRPTDELRPQLEAHIPKFPYDPARALQLLSEAGWMRASDGGLVHQTSGDRFALQIMASAGPGIEREVSIVADYWKAVGVQVEFDLIPPARQGNREYEASMTGVFLTSPGALNYLDARLHSRFTPSAATRWAGSNRGGYNNPAWDSLVDALAVTIDPRERINVLGQMSQTFADIPMMPLFWEIIPVLALRGVKLTPPSDQTATWGMFEWDYKS